MSIDGAEITVATLPKGSWCTHGYHMLDSTYERA